jgi:general secretion pathway protein A
MIQSYWGLTREPFSKDLKPELAFPSESFRESLSRLTYMSQHRGIMLLVGESGTGKTLVQRAFLDQLNPALYQIFYFPLATISPFDLYRQFALALNGESSTSKVRLFNSIQKAVLHLVSTKKILPVFVLDEAHHLKIETLQEIQIILNFQIDSKDPFLFILSGQPLLKDRVRRPVLEPLDQRLAIKIHMEPLKRPEVKPYIEHHLKIAGKSEPVFTDPAIEAISQHTHGIPRLIGNICRKALLYGVLEKKKIIDENDIYRLLQEV